MRHRKKLLGAFSALVAGLAVFHFWPPENVEARRLLDRLRSLLESEQQNDRPAPATAKIDADAQIELYLIVAKVNMTDATSGLFANSANACNTANVRDTRVVRVASRQRIVDLLRELGSAQAAAIVAEPRLVPKPGKAASIAFQVSIPIKPLGPGPGLIYRNVGINVGFTTKAAPSGRVHLELDCEASCIAGKQTIATPQGPVDQPLLDVRRFTTSLELADNETMLIGGLTQKGTMPVNFKVPLLAGLDGIGPWFCFSWQRPIDEELIMLVTPRIVHRRQPPPAPLPMIGRPVALK